LLDILWATKALVGGSAWYICSLHLIFKYFYCYVTYAYFLSIVTSIGKRF